MFKFLNGLIILVVLACGYMHFRYKSFSSDDSRINAAIPLSYEAQQVVAKLAKRSGGKVPADLAAQFDARMTNRASGCLTGSRPVYITNAYTRALSVATPSPALMKIGFFTSPADIRHALGDSKCFADADTELTDWIGAQMLALYLADPPLRPIPAKPVTTLAFKARGPADVFSASKAGVIMMQSAEGTTLVDASSGEPVRATSDVEAGHTEGLSPNGRVYAVTHEERTDFKESATGDVIASTRVCKLGIDCGFHWVDSRSFLTYATSRRTSVVYDIRNSHAAEFVYAAAPVMALHELPNSPNTYLSMTDSAAMRIHFTYYSETPLVTADSIKEMKQTFDPIERGSMTSDGSVFVHGSGSTVYITNVSTLDTQVLNLEPYILKRTLLTNDPNKVILLGTIKNIPDVPVDLVYDIAAQKIAAIDTSKVAPGDFAFLQGINKLALVTPTATQIIDGVPTTDPVDLATFHAQCTALFDSRQSADVSAHQSEQRTLKDSQYANPSSPDQIVLEKGGVYTHADLKALAQDASIQAVGILHALGAGSTTQTIVNTNSSYVFNGRVTVVPRQQVVTRGTASVRVVVGAGPRTIVILSSAEQVRWDIQLEPGAHVRAFLLSGHGGAQLTGQGEIPVVTIGPAAPYASGTPQFDALQTEVQDWTGKQISQFQGMSEAARFMIGG